MKKIFSIGAAVLGTAVFLGMYQYFRAPKSARDTKPALATQSIHFKDEIAAGKARPGDIIQLTGQVVASESNSIELRGGILITRSADEAATTTWPEEGTQTFIAKFNGIEVDEFFGDTLYRLNDGFLLHSADSKDLDES